MRKNEKGQAYLFILIIMMSVFIMLSLALYISGYEARVSSSYHFDSNLYLMAVSGVEEGAALINETGLQAHAYLTAEAGREIFGRELLQYVEYRLDSLSAQYEGCFHLKEKDEGGLRGEADILFQGIYGRLAADYIQTELDKLLDKKDGAHCFSFEIGDYRVEVKITVEDSSFIIESYALSESGATLAEARVDCDFGGHAEILVPLYVWKTPPIWSEHPLYAGAALTGAVIEFPETLWSLEEPFVFTDGSRNTLDVGNFYDPLGDLPVYTAVYSKGNLILEAGTPGRNTFNGVAAACGDIILRGVQVQGSVLAGGNIIEEVHSETIEHRKEADAVFKIDGRNKVLERTFYDLLGITNFRGADDLHITGGKLSNLLESITVRGDSGIDIQNVKGTLFKIVALREIRR